MFQKVIEILHNINACFIRSIYIPKLILTNSSKSPPQIMYLNCHGHLKNAKAHIIISVYTEIFTKIMPLLSRQRKCKCVVIGMTY